MDKPNRLRRLENLARAIAYCQALIRRKEKGQIHSILTSSMVTTGQLAYSSSYLGCCQHGIAVCFFRWE
jgi:hypothetical protein